AATEPLTGHGHGLAVSHGGLASGIGVPGQALGISAAAGELGRTADGYTDIAGFGLGIATTVGSLTRVLGDDMGSLYSTIGANQLPANPLQRTGGVYSVTHKGKAVLLDLMAAAIQGEVGDMYQDVMGGAEAVASK